MSCNQKNRECNTQGCCVHAGPGLARGRRTRRSRTRGMLWRWCLSAWRRLRSGAAACTATPSSRMPCTGRSRQAHPHPQLLLPQQNTPPYLSTPPGPLTFAVREAERMRTCVSSQDLGCTLLLPMCLCVERPKASAISEGVHGCAVADDDGHFQRSKAVQHAVDIFRVCDGSFYLVCTGSPRSAGEGGGQLHLHPGQSNL